MSDKAVVLLNNSLRLMCFTALAIVFDKWWLVLFVIFFWFDARNF